MRLPLPCLSNDVACRDSLLVRVGQCRPVPASGPPVVRQLPASCPPVWASLKSAVGISHSCGRWAGLDAPSQMADRAHSRCDWSLRTSRSQCLGRLRDTRPDLLMPTARPHGRRRGGVNWPARAPGGPMIKMKDDQVRTRQPRQARLVTSSSQRRKSLHILLDPGPPQMFNACASGSGVRRIRRRVGRPLALATLVIKPIRQ